MAVPTNNPLESSHTAEESSPVSQKTYHIAGILCTVYGLDELPADIKDVACLWLLHPRLQTHSSMAPVGADCIRDWNSKLERPGTRRIGLIAVSFDQRNHGSRKVYDLGNESWKKGNKRHAQDMFSIYHGTAQDTSILIDFLSSYIFPTASHTLTTHLVLGISLGGHAVWHCLLQDPRITTGVVVIGCPDYIRLMSDRARLSKLPSYVSTSPPGRDFLGSADFPKGLIEAVEKFDPAGLLLGELDTVTGDEYKHEPSETEKTRLRPILRDRLGGKRILCLSGGKDKLVPYKMSEPFLGWLKNALSEDGGWFNDRGTLLVDVVDGEAAHAYSSKMKTEAVRFISETLAAGGTSEAGSRTSKI